MVGRPREFDPEQVLEAAMQAFWAKGYEATSLADLMSVTGLHKGSLYQAFGDKHSLFVQALKRYLEDMRRQKNQLLANAPTPFTGVRSVLHQMIEIVDDSRECPKGCMAINSMVELAPHDKKVQQIMGDHVQRMRASMDEAITQAQASGEIRSERTPEVITTLILTFMAGIGVTMKGLLTKSEAHELMDAHLEAFL